MDFVMQEDLRWASHWVPTHSGHRPSRGRASERCCVTGKNEPQDTEALHSHSPPSQVLDPVKGSSRPSPPTCPFRSEVFIAELRTLFPLHLALHSSWRRNTRNLSLTCPERGLEQRWACRGGRWSFTSAPPWAPQPAALQEPHLVVQAELHEAWGKQEAVSIPALPPQLPDSIKKKKSKFWKAKKTQITQSAGEINILKMWLIADEKKILNSEWVTHNF